MNRLLHKFKNGDSHEAVNLMPNYSHFAIKHADATVLTIFEVAPSRAHRLLGEAYCDGTSDGQDQYIGDHHRAEITVETVSYTDTCQDN